MRRLAPNPTRAPIAASVIVMGIIRPRSVRAGCISSRSEKSAHTIHGVPSIAILVPSRGWPCAFT